MLVINFWANPTLPPEKGFSDIKNLIRVIFQQSYQHINGGEGSNGNRLTTTIMTTIMLNFR